MSKDDTAPETSPPPAISYVSTPGSSGIKRTSETDPNIKYKKVKVENSNATGSSLTKKKNPVVTARVGALEGSVSSLRGDIAGIQATLLKLVEHIHKDTSKETVEEEEEESDEESPP